MHHNCSKDHCQYGVRKKTQFIVTGAMLSVWGAIGKETAKQLKIIRKLLAPYAP
jgi:hypothetical protein